MTRKEAREAGFIIIFEHEFQKLDADQLLELYYTYRSEVEGQQDYLENLVRTTLTNLPDIDKQIEENAQGWTLSRISKVSLAALRIGICELLYDDSIADSIAINEAVQLAKEYETQKASAFVNGILSTVFKNKTAN
ncbi:MAG: transcription antitermination factor NusB [Ruminococcaceae bacterium]|nr:transcription antitermination factor NusB [Oscillospiraceae bacterium]